MTLNLSPIQILQHQLLNIIDTACTKDRITDYADESLKNIVNYLLTGNWNFFENQIPNQIQIIPRLPVNQFPSIIPGFNPYPIISPLKTSVQQSPEVERVGNRLAGFSWKNANSWKQISKLFGDDIKQITLRNIAEDLSHKLDVHLDRDAKRRKCVLIKWFDENWNRISSLIENYSIKQDNLYFLDKLIQNHE